MLASPGRSVSLSLDCERHQCADCGEQLKVLMQAYSREITSAQEQSKWKGLVKMRAVPARTLTCPPARPPACVKLLKVGLVHCCLADPTLAVGSVKICYFLHPLIHHHPRPNLSCTPHPPFHLHPYPAFHPSPFETCLALHCIAVQEIFQRVGGSGRWKAEKGSRWKGWWGAPLLRH